MYDMSGHVEALVRPFNKIQPHVDLVLYILHFLECKNLVYMFSSAEQWLRDR